MTKCTHKQLMTACMLAGTLMLGACTSSPPVTKEVSIVPITNHLEETIDAFYKLSRLEGIIPAIESAHAVAYGMKLAKQMGKGSILINLSGRGDKDMDYVIEKYGIPEK